MNVSFAPLRPDAVKLLCDGTHVDFSYESFQQPKWFCATARDDDGMLMGVLACEFRTYFDASFNTVIVDRRCLTRRLLRAVFTALFSRAVRVTAEVAVSNADALRSVPRMGFLFEGCCRKGINGVEDAWVFGMLREDCKFLPGNAGGTVPLMEMPDGQRIFGSA